MTNKRAILSRCLDTAGACSYVNVAHGLSYDDRECSSISTVSDADSFAIRHQSALATVNHGTESVKIASVCLEMLQGISGVTPDDCDKVRREEIILREAAWTDEKHGLYLNLMESEFVRSLCHKKYRTSCFPQLGHARFADSAEEDCVESHPTINFQTYCESEEILKSHLQQAVNSIQLRPITELAGLTSLSVPSLSMSGEDVETDSSRSSCSICVDVRFQTDKTKERALDFGHEYIDLELRLSDLTTRLFQQHHASNFMSERKDSNRRLNIKRKLQDIDH